MFNGSALESWRKSRGWKRTYIAHLLGVSVTTLWSWEKREDELPRLVLLACRAVDSNLKPMGE